MDYERLLAILILTLIGIVVGALYALVISVAFAWAWNEFAVPVLKLPALSFIHSFAGLVLIQLAKSAYKGFEMEIKFRKD